jgi:hypothetical protein
MNRKQRRTAAKIRQAGFRPIEEAIAEFTDYVLADVIEPVVVIGPVVWQPDPDRNGKRRWYFNVSSAGPEGFRTDQLGAEDAALADEMRAVFAMALVRRRPIVMHDCDDELYMARLCETLWPGPKIQRLRADIERERSEAAVN